MSYTEVEANVLEATNDDAWGPTGQLMQEIAQATFTCENFPEVIGMLWKRLLQDKRNWRRIYKVIYHCSKRVSYDSMRTVEEACLRVLHDYLCQEYKDKKAQILDPSNVTETMKDIPQQMNGSDCGMFTLKYAEYISRNAEITFDQEHMQYFRRRTVYELLNNQFL